MASVGFRWLDILEKEFDKAFVDLDLAIGEIDSEEPDVVFNVRQKLCTLGSCFAQLTHKSQTIFQNSAKIEAELIHMRAELIDVKSKKELLESELHNLLLQLHSSQLSQLPDTLGNKKLDQHFKPDVNTIKKKLEAEIRQSPSRLIRMNSKDGRDQEELKFSPVAVKPTQLKAENLQLLAENAALRNSILSLTSEVYGAKLAAKYLDKELAGRIQQLQLLGREMRGDVRDKLWRQLESEILLQRHKTVVRACRRNSSVNNSEKCPKPENESIVDRTEHFGDIRTILVKRKPNQGLGISITGGREHGVPILISELEPNGPAALSDQLYIGDAILFVNDIDLRNSCHKEAVAILQKQAGDCVLKVQYIAADDSDNSLEEDGFSFRFFDDEVRESNTPDDVKGSPEMVNTPTAPRTPESSSSRLSRESGQRVEKLEDVPPFTVATECDENNGNVEYNQTTNYNLANNANNNAETTEKSTLKGNDNLINIDTTDLVLLDNVTNNLIKLEDFKKVDVFSTVENNFNCSSNSLNSENLSSPMQTSTDVYLDSEILSTDAISNDSQSPKNLQTEAPQKSFDFPEHVKADRYGGKPETNIYASNDSLSNPKSDQSLINSAESCGSSPVLHKMVRDYKKRGRCRKKYFGVKTLQSIFTRNDGYSDLSSTASEYGDEALPPAKLERQIEEVGESPAYAETSPQFEENIHAILSDIFARSQAEGAAARPLSNALGTKKYFSLHGQSLRVGKALRLCPNEELGAAADDQKKEKLLARYVYNANSLNADGVGDPDFGTPV